MGISIGLIMGFVGASIALLIAILIFSEVSQAVQCPEEGMMGFEECTTAKDTAWTVLGILPVMMFFVLFMIFGGFGGSDEFSEGKVKQVYVKNTRPEKSRYVEPITNETGSLLKEVLFLFKRGEQ